MINILYVIIKNKKKDIKPASGTVLKFELFLKIKKVNNENIIENE